MMSNISTLKLNYLYFPMKRGKSLLCFSLKNFDCYPIAKSIKNTTKQRPHDYTSLHLKNGPKVELSV